MNNYSETDIQLAMKAHSCSREEAIEQGYAAKVCDIRFKEYKQHEYRKYQYMRQYEYPSLADQLDMLWHSMDDNESLRIEPFYSTIKGIKDKYPKPFVKP